MNPCPTSPVCDFGFLGPEALAWISVVGSPFIWETQAGVGGVFGMCGHRPLTALELRQKNVRGDRMGQRSEVDTVNVVPCDEAYEAVRELRQ